MIILRQISYKIVYVHIFAPNFGYNYVWGVIYDLKFIYDYNIYINLIWSYIIISEIGTNIYAHIQFYKKFGAI